MKKYFVPEFSKNTMENFGENNIFVKKNGAMPVHALSYKTKVSLTNKPAAQDFRMC